MRETALDHVVGRQLFRQRQLLRRRPARARFPELRAGDRGAAAETRRDLGPSTRRCSPGSATRRLSGLPPTATSRGCSSPMAGLVRYDMSHEMEAPPSGQVLIRRIVGSQDKRVVYGRYGDADRHELRRGVQQPPFRIRASVLPRRERDRSYQSRLDGFDTGLVGLDARRTTRYVHNLGFGDYHFRVRARGISGAVSDEGGCMASRSCRPGTARGWHGCYIMLGVLALSGVTRLTRLRVTARETASGRSSLKRSCEPTPPSPGAHRERREEKRRAAQRDGARDHARRSTSTPSSARSTSE